MKIAVIGGGAWGTALANAWAGKGIGTRLWVREPELVEAINLRRENQIYLPGVRLAAGLTATSDRAEAVRDAAFAVFVVPSQFFRAALREFKPLLPEGAVIVCANKGVELQTLATMSEIVAQELGDLSARFAMLSGPSFAKEVAAGMPTAVALGCADQALGEELREALSTEALRVYSNPDFRGVELGGALKNIIAIAVGCADGLEFGHNARAALITRGLTEMSRLGVALGAEAATFQGLAGMGDLVLTCTGDLSRNRQVGLALGRGKTLDEILKDMKAVAEGVKTTESVYHLAKKLGVPMPITDQLYAILYEGKDPRRAVRELMTRELKAE